MAQLPSSSVLNYVADRTNENNPPVLLYGNPDTHAMFVEIAAENILSITTPIYATSLVIKPSAGRLKGLTGYNSKGTTQFIQLHDAISLPADLAIPKVILTVSATSNFSLDYGAVGRYFTAGIVVCNSSTGPTKTIGAADCWFDCQFV